MVPHLAIQTRTIREEVISTEVTKSLTRISRQGQSGDPNVGVCYLLRILPESLPYHHHLIQKELHTLRMDYSCTVSPK